LSVKKKSREKKKILIIEAAARVFARKGFNGTVIQDIATEAGIGKGTIYEYFESKNDLFFSVFEWLFAELAGSARVRVSTLAGTASAKLEALSDSLTRAAVELQDYFSLFMEFWAASGASPNRDRFKAFFQQFYDEFRGLVINILKDGMDRHEFRTDLDPKSIAAVLVGSWDGLLLQTWFEEAFDPVEAAKNFMPVLIKGLLNSGHENKTGEVSR
jgi:TetR/AcrR family fatty acid metabolism transcriptional regulator